MKNIVSSYDRADVNKSWRSVCRAPVVYIVLSVLGVLLSIFSLGLFLMQEYLGLDDFGILMILLVPLIVKFLVSLGLFVSYTERLFSIEPEMRKGYPAVLMVVIMVMDLVFAFLGLFGVAYLIASVMVLILCVIAACKIESLPKRAEGKDESYG